MIKIGYFFLREDVLSQISQSIFEQSQENCDVVVAEIASKK